MENIRPYINKIIFILIGVAIGLLGIMVFSKITTSLFVEDIRPAHRTDFIALNESVRIHFNRALSDSDKERIALSVYPETTITQTWTDNQILTIVPAGIWKPGESYVLTIWYKNQLLLNSQFTTISTTSLSPEDDLRIASEVEQRYAQEETHYYAERPWLNSLPLITDRYSARWIQQDQSILVKIKDPESFNQDALFEELTRIGVDISQTTVRYER